jgi:hypothetical protein
MMTIAQRLERYGPLKTYLALADSLKFPNHYYNEEIFRQGGPSGARQTMENLLMKIPIDDIHFALDALRPNKFNFEKPLTEAFTARVRRQMPIKSIKVRHRSRRRKVFLTA